MVPRLAFHEWEGFNAGESAQQMTGASRAWPGLTLLTLADIKTAAWLVENNHLTHLERIIFSTDLHSQSGSADIETIKRVAVTFSTKTDDQIFLKGIIFHKLHPLILSRTHLQGLHVHFLTNLFFSCLNDGRGTHWSGQEFSVELSLVPGQMVH